MNENLARWIFASVAYYLKTVAQDNNLPVWVDQLDERTERFVQSPDKVEIRVTGPFVKMKPGTFHVQMDVNVLLSSRYEGTEKNAYDIHKYAGIFQAAMMGPIPVWNYGPELGDYVDDDEGTQTFLGCLLTKDGPTDSVRVYHFGQTDKTDKLKCAVVDAHYEMNLE